MANGITYIQRRDEYGLETVDEFNTWKEAREMRDEYSVSDPYANYYCSSRACRDWREPDQ